MSETKQGVCWECGEPLLIPTSYGYHPACVNVAYEKANKEADDLPWKKARDIVEDMLSTAEHFQTECQVLTKEIIEQKPKCNVQDATNVWMFNKLAEFEIRCSKFINHFNKDKMIQTHSSAGTAQNAILSAYQTLRSVPKFPHATYRINMFWHMIKNWMAGQVNVELNPDYQRGYVWTQEQKERYLEYRIKDGLSGRIIYWNCSNWKSDVGSTEWHNTLELVDGKQRLNAVFEFMENKVKVFGKYMNEYPDADRMIKGLVYDFEFHINNLPTKAEVVEWYLGLNNGGSVHTEDDLSVARNVLNGCR